MRIPNQAPQTPEAPAQPAAAPATPPPAAPAGGDAPGGQDAFLAALAEETAREQREAAAPKAAKADAEAELMPLHDAPAGEPGYGVTEGPVPPAAAPDPVAPVGEGVPEDKDAFFQVLAEQAAREQAEAAAAQAAKTDAEAESAPSPEATVRGQSSAVKELRIKRADDKSGYAIAGGPLPKAPAEYEVQPQPPWKLIGAAAGVFLLIILIIAIKVGASGSSSRRKLPAKEVPVLRTPSAPQPEAAAPELPTALKAVAQALAARTLVEVEVVEAATDAAAERMPVLTPAGDLMLDATNVRIRGKSGAGDSIEELRSASRSAVYKSVAARLQERGLTPVEAGRSAAGNPEGSRSRLKVFISATPAWAEFSFRERPAPLSMIDDMPSQSGQPSQHRPTRFSSHRTDRALSHVSLAPPSEPVKLWERLVSGGTRIGARFGFGTAQDWLAIPTDDLHGDPLPCGLRISIVRVVWEVSGQTYELTGRAAEADTTPFGNEAETGAASPFHRPKHLREVQLSGQMNPDRTFLLSGLCQYDDVDLYGGAEEAGKLAAGLLGAPDADWQRLLDGKADNDAIAAACRNILRLDGGPAIIEVLTAKPERLPRSSMGMLVSVLKEERSSPQWASPFLAVRGPCGDAALICLARQPREENQKDFLQWVTTPADHSPESVQAACCALIDLGRPGPEVNALIDSHAVKAFSEVRSPRGSLAFPSQTAQTVLEWLIRNGTDSQRIGAAVAAATGRNSELQGEVRAFVSQSLRSDPKTLYILCKGIEKEQSPLAFEILSSVARQLMQTDAGDRFPPPAALAEGGGPPLTGRYSRTVAALVCAGLARFDRFEAGKALVGLMQSPGPATRYCAIETLMALDDVDVSKEIRARFDFLSKRPRNAYEAQEWELLNPLKNKLCRYDIPILSAENALKNGARTKEVIEICDGIIKENPSPTLVERARNLKSQAEKVLERSPSTPH
jgi:hypothetical protein